MDTIIQILTPMRQEMAERQAAEAEEAAKLDAFLNPPDNNSANNNNDEGDSSLDGTIYSGLTSYP